MISGSCSTLTSQRVGLLFGQPHLVTEVTHEWQGAQRRQLCGQLGTPYLFPEAREKVTATGTHSLWPCSSPGLIPPPDFLPGSPREERLGFSPP